MVIKHPPLLVDVEDLQYYIGLGKTTVYDLISKGKFPEPKRVGRRSLWDMTEVQQWVTSLNHQAN